MAKRVVVIRHGDDPPDDRVHTYLTQNGFDPEIRRPFSGESLGEPDGFLAGTVLHGGPYNAFATSEHPFLNEEYRWIDACLKADVPMLGISQGAQQIALHLGADVGPAPGESHEFGYYKVEPTEAGEAFLPEATWFTQAHYHTFGIPDGAKHLARSEAFENQAFSYGTKVWSLQFHAEVTIEGFRRWQNADWAAYGKPGAQTREEQDRMMAKHDARQAEWFYGFLGSVFGKADAARTAA